MIEPHNLAACIPSMRTISYIAIWSSADVMVVCVHVFHLLFIVSAASIDIKLYNNKHALKHVT